MPRFIGILFAVELLVGLKGGPVRAEDFPASIVSWVPAPDAATFVGAGGNAWDKKIRERGWITLEGSTYHLWYTGYNEDLSPLRKLGHATSPNGRTWTRDTANPIYGETWVEDVCQVPHQGVRYLFAEGKDDIAHVLTSSDGIRWTERGPLDIRKVDGSPIPPGPRGTPSAIFDNGSWYLLYERGDRGVWLAKSSDRQVWRNVRDEPVLGMGPAEYDKTAIAVDQIFKRQGVYYALYHANSHQPWSDWTTCVARSEDLVHWEKYSGNPIIQGNCSSSVFLETPEGDRLYTMHPEMRLFVHPER